jgi:hypothetical protein
MWFRLDPFGLGLGGVVVFRAWYGWFLGMTLHLLAGNGSFG